MASNRRILNTTIDAGLYAQLQHLAIDLSIKENRKIKLNEIIETGIKLALDKYKDELKEK